MTRSSLIKTFMVLMAALFFVAQGFSQAHAASNGDLDHSHDGVACEVALIAAEQVVLTPPAPVPAPVILPRRIKTPQPVVKSAPRSFDSRAPPLKGPPL
jgi:hypothetical protein